METYVIAFESTHAAMATERALASVGTTMLPTPRAISAGCGMSLRYEAESADRALAIARMSAEAAGMATLFVQRGDRYEKVANV